MATCVLDWGDTAAMIGALAALLYAVMYVIRESRCVQIGLFGYTNRRWALDRREDQGVLDPVTFLRGYEMSFGLGLQEQQKWVQLGCFPEIEAKWRRNDEGEIIEAELRRKEL